MIQFTTEREMQDAQLRRTRRAAEEMERYEITELASGWSVVHGPARYFVSPTFGCSCPDAVCNLGAESGLYCKHAAAILLRKAQQGRETPKPVAAPLTAEQRARQRYEDFGPDCI